MMQIMYLSYLCLYVPVPLFYCRLSCSTFLFLFIFVSSYIFPSSSSPFSFFFFLLQHRLLPPFFFILLSSFSSSFSLSCFVFVFCLLLPSSLLPFFCFVFQNRWKRCTNRKRRRMRKPLKSIYLSPCDLIHISFNLIYLSFLLSISQWPYLHPCQPYLSTLPPIYLPLTLFTSLSTWSIYPSSYLSPYDLTYTFSTLSIYPSSYFSLNDITYIPQPYLSSSALSPYDLISISLKLIYLALFLSISQWPYLRPFQPDLPLYLSTWLNTQIRLPFR